MIQVARNERLDRANNCFNCSHTRCGVFVNVEQTRFAWPSRNIARSAFPGLRVKNISDNFKRFRPANLKGMPIGSLCARPIFPIFFAQTSRLPIPPKNHHYSASLRLINPRRSNRLFIAKANPPFPSLLPPSSNSDLFKNRNSHFVERGFEKAPSETRFSARKDVSRAGWTKPRPTGFEFAWKYILVKRTRSGGSKGRNEGAIGSIWSESR